MNEAFEVWAPKEIKRLREEADVLQLAFDRFTGAQGRKPRSAPTQSHSNEGQGRRSKYDKLYAKWADASQAHPIGYGEMERIAMEEGFEMNKSLLRSTAHAAKQAGRARAEGDGYVWFLPETKTASPDQEDAAQE